MAVKVTAVDTDLSVAANTINDASSDVGWIEPTGTGSVSGGSYADMKGFQTEADVYIQGIASMSGAYTTNAPDRGALVWDNTSTITIPTDGAVLIWMWWIAPLSLEVYATAGQFMLIGSTVTTTLNAYPVGGSDMDPAPLGGWYCYAVDPNVATAYENLGTAATVWNVFGGGIAAPKQGRGLTHYVIDAMRYGRCTAEVTGGTSGADATFVDISDALQATSVSYGVFDNVQGAFYMQGMLQFGDNANADDAVDFTDSNAVINIRNTPNVGTGFNRIEIQNGLATVSNVSWTNCVFNNIGTLNAVAPTNSLGDLEVIDDTANLDITGCSFTDMGTFIFGSVSTMINTTFRRTSTVTQNGATFTGCIFDSSSAATSLVADNIGLVTECNFISVGSPGTNSAVDLGTISSDTAVTWNNTETGYVTGTPGTDVGVTPTGNETITVVVESGFVLTINVTSGASTPSVAVTGGPGSPSNFGTVDVIAGSVDTIITVIDAISTDPVEGARVYVTDTGSPITTYIFGAEGTLTNASGVVSDSRVLGGDLVITGWVRRATLTAGSPLLETFYKTGGVSGTISSATGFSTTVQLIPDQ